MTATTDFTEFLKQKREVEDLKAARTRIWGVWLKLLSIGAFGSVWQSAVTGNWKPTGIATIVAIPCALISPADMGITLMVAPPVTAAAMFTAKTTSARNKYRFIMPEQADAALIEKGIF